MYIPCRNESDKLLFIKAGVKIGTAKTFMEWETLGNVLGNATDQHEQCNAENTYNNLVSTQTHLKHDTPHESSKSISIQNIKFDWQKYHADGNCFDARCANAYYRNNFPLHD